MRVGWVCLGLALLAAGCGARESPRTPSVPAGATAATQARAPFSPIQTVDASDPKQIQLGKALFGDKRFSADGTVACGTCHDVANGGALL
jgi:cytochrome c peroxidase